MSSNDADTGRAVIVRAESAEVVELAAGSAFRLLVDASDTGGALGVNRLTLGVGADGAAPHHHALSSEAFYVLDGVMEFLLGDRLVTVAGGDLVVVPPGMPHAFGAAPDSTADVLVVMTPGVERFGYFRHLGLVARGQEPRDGLPAVQARHDVHPVSSAAWQAARTPVTR
ncbi:MULTISPECIES: cupin domain-containing protein [Streptosporangium]|uniref:Quercetin dioxygenase-like cupin family protein n=1 Tax=Streptosporangium brasiliense TaxID=47480 RepID=A0ABT9R281_9ACTN|nr:cupin domain-containing protein [Streptosporangium brasiliense]MDP9863336.1 quercetin dioxygenase-like cupin family protein [Streptosporangium brasiliense]